MKTLLLRFLRDAVNLVCTFCPGVVGHGDLLRRAVRSACMLNTKTEVQWCKR